jgi:hypothetical protein
VITFTTAEVAEQLRVSSRKVRKLAEGLGLGANVGGTAGYRYVQSDIDAMWQSMRPVQTVTPRRRRRTA